MNDYEGFKTSGEEVATEVVETARDLELTVEPEDVIEIVQSHDTTITNEELLLLGKQRKWFLEMETTSDDAAKTVEMTTKYLDYYIILMSFQHKHFSS